MERIKEIDKIKVRADMLLVEVMEKPESLIIIPDASKEKSISWDYAKVLAVGSKVDDVNIGDIVLSYTGGAHIFKVRNRSYSQLMRHLCDVIVSPDNFTFDK